jgi:hypothetical protein
MSGPLAVASWWRACARLVGDLGGDELVTVETQNLPACSQL